MGAGSATLGIRHMSKRFYITTAIDYVNGQPHLGHAYEDHCRRYCAVAAQRTGNSFLTGLDEHGREESAAGEAEAGSADVLRPRRRLGPRLPKHWLTNDDFVRTTQPRRKATCRQRWRSSRRRAISTNRVTRDFIPPKEETFLTEKDRLPDGNFDPGYGDVVELKAITISNSGRTRRG